MNSRAIAHGTYDVAVAGGGPAGAMAALQLARSGAAVLLVERSVGHQRKLGETLPPAAARILKEHGLWDAFRLTSPVPVWLNASAWGSSRLGFDDLMFGADGPGWHFDRGQFESVLRVSAERAGAEVRFDCAITGIHSDAQGHRLEFVQGRAPGKARASFFIDASGRGCHAWQVTRSRIHRDRLIGIGLIARLPVAHEPSSFTLVESVSDGWFYSAQVSASEIIACYMTDPDIYSDLRRQHTDVFQSRLAEASHTRERLASANALSRRWCAGAGSSLRTSAAGTNWIAIGDAAMSCDPLSASGIVSALNSGIYAATLAGSTGGTQQPESWTQYLSSTFTAYLAQRKHYYSLEQRWPNSVFWQRRQQATSHSPLQSREPVHALA